MRRIYKTVLKPFQILLEIPLKYKMRSNNWLQNLYYLLIVATLMIQVVAPAQTMAQVKNFTKPVAEMPDRISVAYCSDCVPFHFQDEKGLPAGMLIDFWRLWSEKTGVAIDFRSAPWDDSLAMVGGGVADAHAGLFFNKERDKFLDYGSALRKTDTHVFIHKTLPTVSRIEELSAYRVGVLAKDYVEGYLKKRLPKAIIVPYPDYASIMMALKDGTLKVFAADTPTGIYHLQRHNLIEQFSFSKELLLYQNDWYAAARQGNAELIKIINEGMSQISQSEKTEIGRRWSAVTKEKKTDALLISMDRAYPPMTFLNAQGRPAGFLVDLWRLWSEKTGREIRFKENNWKQSVEALRNGEADVHSGLFKNDEREQWLNFAPEVYRIGTGLYHRAGEKISDKLTEVEGQTIGIIAGSHQEIMARTRWPNLQLTQFNTTQELIQSLLKENVIAVLAEIPVMDVLLNQMGMRGEIVLKPGQLFVNAFHPAVLKERKKILKSVEQGFSRISQRELAMLEKRWVDDPAKRVYAQKFRLDSKAVPLNLTEEEKQWLKEHPVIRMGVDRSWPPFEFLDDMNQHTGIAADFMQLMEERLAIRFVPPPNISWAEVIAKTKKGELDILSVLAPTKEREKFLHFTNPYIQAPFVIVRRAGTSSVSGLNDLSGQKVGVVSGYAAEEKVRQQAPHLNIVPAKDLSEGLLALSTGKTDAFVGNLPSVKHFIQILFLNNLEVGASAGFTLDLTIGVRKDWPILTEILNKSIRSVTKEEKRKILRMESSEEVKGQGTDISLVRIIIGVAILALILITAIILLNRYLKTARAKGLSEDLFQSTRVRAIGMGVIGLFIAMTIILAWTAINHINLRIRQDMESTLSNILKSSQDSLRIWVENSKRSLAQLLIEPELLQPVVTLLAAPQNKDALAKNSAQENVREFFNSRITTSRNEGFLVISPDLFTISAYKDAEIRSINHISQRYKEFVKRALRGELVFIPPIKSYSTFTDESGKKKESTPAMFFVGPLRSSTGKVIAAVSLRIDPFQDFTQLTQGGRLGESGDTYAFNKQGYLLSESRFEGQMEKLGLISQGQNEILTVRMSDPGGNLTTGFQDSPPLNSRPLTLMAQSATAGEAGTNIQGYRDNRGVPVLGAWLWDDVLGLGLASEINMEEALEPYYSVRNIIVLVLSVIVIFALILTALSAWIGEQANLTLKKSRDDLEDRVKERTQELYEARNESEKASQAKSMFISSMSHELKTPMNAILGFSQVLKSNKDINKKVKNSVESIHKAANHLMGLVNDILDFSTAEDGLLEMKRINFDLVSLLNDLSPTYKRQCEKKGIELEVKGMVEHQHLYLNGDRRKIRQVLINLLSNAVKFTDSGSVQMRVEPTTNDHFNFEVIDTGSGIPLSNQQTIFDSFHQQEKGFKKGGLGLGLSMSRRLVEVMGGELQVESAPDKGSRFFFTLNLPAVNSGTIVIDHETEAQEDVPDELEEQELDYSSFQLPSIMIDEIKKFVDLGMLDDIEPQLSEMEKVEPHGKKLAETLRDLGEQFETDKILEILGKIKTN